MACCSLSHLFPSFVITILFHLPTYNVLCLSLLNFISLLSDHLSTLKRVKIIRNSDPVIQSALHHPQLCSALYLPLHQGVNEYTELG